MMHWTQVIDHFQLSPHPEGGFYRRTYCSDEILEKNALPSRYASDHPISSAILYLLRSGEYAKLHRIRQDECWHFYMGSPLRLIMFSPDPNHSVRHEYLLGTDFRAGHCPQIVVPSGWWFGASVVDGSSFSLVGCTVAPAFLFEDWELGVRSQLVSDYPMFEDTIIMFTDPD